MTLIDCGVLSISLSILFVDSVFVATKPEIGPCGSCEGDAVTMILSGEFCVIAA